MGRKSTFQNRTSPLISSLILEEFLDLSVSNCKIGMIVPTSPGLLGGLMRATAWSTWHPRRPSVNGNGAGLLLLPVMVMVTDTQVPTNEDLEVGAPEEKSNTSLPSVS